MPDDTVPAAPAQSNDSSWMTDVQRLIALALILTFSVSTIILMIRLVMWGEPATLVDLTKTFQSALINMAMVVLGYFFGSSKSKDSSDTSQQKIVEKLTSTQPPNGTGPVAPIPAPAPVVVVSWWSLLTPEEQAAIVAAAPADAQVQVALTALQSGKAEAPDIATLVTKNLLTQARAAVVTAAA